MRLAAFKARVDALAQGRSAASDAALLRAMDKKEIRRCSKAWEVFARECSAEAPRRPPPLRQMLPSQCLPPVA